MSRPVTPRQLEVLRWIADGCPPGRWTDESHKASARALASRALAKVSRPQELRCFVRTLTGHTNYVAGVAFSPDGHLLATAGLDRAVRLWDPATGKHLRTLTRRWDAASGVALQLRTLISGGTVYGVAFSPDGRLLATSSGDKTVRLWDLATGEYLLTLTGHTGAVQGVAFSPDGRLLATAGSDKTARLWDPATGEHLRALTGHTNYVVGVAFSPDGRLLATSSGDKTARLWD